MKARVTSGLFSLLLSTCFGCCGGGGVGTGWRFEVLRPPIVTQTSLVQQGAGDLGVVELGGGGWLRNRRFGAPATLAVDDCLLQQLLIRLTAVEGQLQRLVPQGNPAKPPAPGGQDVSGR